MYECPNCASNLKYSIEHQNMFCEACGTVLSPYEVSKESDAEVREDFEVTVFGCPQCGAQITSEDNEAAAFCSFCGASTILDSRIISEKRPRYILPFQKTKKDCVESFKKMTKRALFAPNELKNYKDIDSFRGIYMPFWMYSAVNQDHIRYDVRKTLSKYRGDYEYIDHYDFETDSNTSYSGITFDASSSFSDDLSQAINPFDTNQLVDFTPSYLSGFYADTSDVDGKTYDHEVTELVTQDYFNILNKDPAMKSFSTTYEKAKGSVQLDISNRTLVMLPVWFMSLRHKGNGQDDRVAYIAVNGQTGEACGDLPIDIRKYLIGAGLSAILCFLLLSILPTFHPLFVATVSAVFVAIVRGIFAYQNSEIEKWETGEADKGLKAAGGALKTKKQNKFDPQTGKPVKKKMELFGFTHYPLIVSIVIAVALWLTRPVSDIWYYLGSIVMLVLVFFILLKLMLRYNALTTRPLPQFKRTGGDDSAKQAIKESEKE